MSHIVPLELQRLRGNPSKRPLHPEPEPERPAQVPDPPEFLSELAKAEWWRISGELHALKLFTTLDVKVLAAYCAACARWETAERALALEGEVEQGPSKPLLRIAREAARDTVRYAGLFGLSPAARVRLRAEGTPVSKFDGLINST